MRYRENPRWQDINKKPPHEIWRNSLKPSKNLWKNCMPRWQPRSPRLSTWRTMAGELRSRDTPTSYRQKPLLHCYWQPFLSHFSLSLLFFLSLEFVSFETQWTLQQLQLFLCLSLFLDQLNSTAKRYCLLWLLLTCSSNIVSVIFWVSAKF